MPAAPFPHILYVIMLAKPGNVVIHKWMSELLKTVFWIVFGGSQTQFQAQRTWMGMQKNSAPVHRTWGCGGN